jgi:hypothetical protein
MKVKDISLVVARHMKENIVIQEVQGLQKYKPAIYYKVVGACMSSATRVHFLDHFTSIHQDVNKTTHAFIEKTFTHTL